MRIGLMTSGGDAPGMNAAIRAAVRCGTERGAEMLGVHRGYNGLIEGDFEPLNNRAVGGIIERGGTMLRSARSEAFLTSEGREKALAEIRQHSLGGLIVIGGNGSLRARSGCRRTVCRRSEFPPRSTTTFLAPRWRSAWTRP